MNKIKNHPHIESFYHLAGQDISDLACKGIACFVARKSLSHSTPKSTESDSAAARPKRVYCLGKCYMAPATTASMGLPNVEIHSSKSVILSRIAAGGAQTLARYEKSGGYDALKKSLTMQPESIIHEVEISELRGRGGAGFPAGKKWRAVFQEASTIKYIVANADEGDPGVYIDRILMELDPHSLLEAMIIAGFATGAQKGYIYLRKEYPVAKDSLLMALSEARNANYLGKNVLGTNLSFEVEIITGQGSYVCGEETALLNSIEGKRAEVRTRPPYPTQSGLWEKPTLVNNVETLAAIPWIILNGGNSYSSLGFSKSRGTKVLALNSLFNRPGLYEIEFGMTIDQIVNHLGGGIKTGAIKGVIFGGPLAGIIHNSHFETNFGFEEMRAIGASVGHGGVVAFDENISIAELIHHIFSFGAFESCGKCTPCRLGSRRLEQIFRRIIQGDKPSHKERMEFGEIIEALYHTSLCGLGSGLGEFALSISRNYPEELVLCFA